MGDRKLKTYLRQSLGEEIRPQRLEETVKFCREMVKDMEVREREERTDFFQYLSDVFRFEGISIVVLQAAVLGVVCLSVAGMAGALKNIPVFMPLFVLAVIPSVFKSRYYGMSEMEAATRASGAQIMLAKLVLAGAANLVCITVILWLEVSFKHSCKELGQMVLYCLVPYLVCLSSLLRVIRLRKEGGMCICVTVIFGSCICWGAAAKALPWLYETSAMGVWAVSFLVFAAFFIREIRYILIMRKEGKMYGIVA